MPRLKNVQKYVVTLALLRRGVFTKTENQTRENILRKQMIPSTTNENGGGLSGALRAMQDDPVTLALTIVESLPLDTVKDVNTALSRFVIFESVRRTDRAAAVKTGR